MYFVVDRHCLTQGTMHVAHSISYGARIVTYQIIQEVSVDVHPFELL